MSNSSIDNKLNEINDRNRQNPQNEPDEEENMSGFEKGRLAALNAKYEDDDEPKIKMGMMEALKKKKLRKMKMMKKTMMMIMMKIKYLIK